MSKIEALHRFPKDLEDLAKGSNEQRHVFVRDLILEAAIGAYESEKGSTQRVRVNVHLTLAGSEAKAETGDKLENVVCYDQLVTGIKGILAAGHINLVETLAKKISDFALDDLRVASVRVRVEKLDAIPEAVSVGVEIERRRNSD